MVSVSSADTKDGLPRPIIFIIPFSFHRLVLVLRTLRKRQRRHKILCHNQCFFTRL